jgi:hypothetical protein
MAGLEGDADDIYLLESKQSPQLDQAVEVAKQDGHGQEHDVTRVSAKQPNQFHYFGKAKHECDLRSQKEVPIPGLPVLRTPPAREEQEGVDQKRQRRKRRNVQRIGTPRLLAVDWGGAVSKGRHKLQG